MQTWAIIPIKALTHAKSRLTPALSPVERAQLALSMFCDVLDTLARVERLAGILVVTSDPDASAIAQEAGATIVPDLVNKGTNSAVVLGLARLRQTDGASVIVIPSDIPFTSVAEIDLVLDRLATNDVVVVPASRDGGTNILALNRPDIIQVAFGEDSYSRHLEAAKLAGVTTSILPLAGAGHDIDVTADLFLGEGEGKATRTRAFLKSIRCRDPISHEAGLPGDMKL